MPRFDLPTFKNCIAIPSFNEITFEENLNLMRFPILILLLTWSVVSILPADALVRLVKDINVSGPDGSSEPTYLHASGSMVYFTADDGTHGAELWRTDGTESGTFMLKDLIPGGVGSRPGPFITSGAKVFFTTFDLESNSLILWRTDGTAGGTISLHDFPWIGGMAGFHDELFFSTGDGQGSSEIWRSDGTEAGTVLFKKMESRSVGAALFRVSGNRLYFIASTASSGLELWKTDGTEAGTVPVKEINHGPGSSNPSSLTSINGVLYFSATDGKGGVELWRSDGTVTGTRMIRDINKGSASSYPFSLTPYKGKIFFSASDAAHGRELWQTNGTPEGTVLVRDIYPGVQGANVEYIKTAANVLFFTASTPATGNELWKTDGTAQGTVLVEDTRPGRFGSKIDAMFATPNLLFFHREGTLWRSDGTSQGTFRLYGNFHLADPSRSMTFSGTGAVLNSVLLFNGSDSKHTGSELWKSDGTDAGTIIVRNIRKGDSADSNPHLLTADGASLLFNAFDGVQQRLWQSGGTSSSTFQVADFAPNKIFPANGTAFLWVQIDRDHFALYKMQGSTSILLNDSFTNVETEMVAFRNRLFFTAYTASSGLELWRSDGTAQGTQLVVDILPGTDSSAPRLLTVHGSMLFFVANNPTPSLWKTDGTAAGTKLISNTIGVPDSRR